MGNGGTNGSLGSGNVTNNGTLAFNLSGNTTVGGAISGTGNLSQAGTGTTTLTGNNTYSGTTNITGGTLQVGNGGVSGTLGSGAVMDNANLVINYASAVNLSTVASCSSGITGNGNFTAVSGGALGIDRAINLSAGNGSIVLEAGAGMPAGTATGGDVTLSQSVSTGSSGTITIFSGNPNTAAYESQLGGATGPTRYKTYNAGAASLSGAVSGTRNYYYRGQQNVTVSNLSATKVYDGTSNASGFVNSNNANVAESVADDAFQAGNLTQTAATFNSSHALGANGSVLNVSFGQNVTYTDAGGTNWSVAGANINNYSGQTGTITPANLTVTAAGDTKTYDGTTASTATATVTGLVGSDALNGPVTQAYNSSHVLGTNGSSLNVAAPLTNASLTGGGFITDYTVSYVNASGTITPANLTVTAAGDTKTYDGTTASTATATVTGLVGSDALNGPVAESYYSPHALGSNQSILTPVALSNASIVGGGYVTDYSVNYVNGSGTITPAALNVAAGTTFTLHNASLTALANMTSNVPAGTGYISDFFSNNITNNGNLDLADPMTVGNIGGGGSLAIDSNVNAVNVTGNLSQANVTVDPGGALNVGGTTNVTNLDNSGSTTLGNATLGNVSGAGNYTQAVNTVANVRGTFSQGHTTVSSGAAINVNNQSTTGTGRTDVLIDQVLTIFGYTQWPGWYDDDPNERVGSSSQFVTNGNSGQGNGVNIPSMKRVSKKVYEVRVVEHGINTGEKSQ
ncbi:hypothetical protein WJ62_03050 [Burkholderia diffusa]|nr:hypothetical protein WJ62_03050 [Burkholderia diffusa]